MKWLAVIALMVLATAAQAETPVVILDRAFLMESIEVPREGQNFSYLVELGEDPTQVRFQNVLPDSIEHRFLIQAAVGQDGSWRILEDISAVSSWQMATVERQGTAYAVRLYAVRSDEEGKVRPTPTSVQLNMEVEKQWPGIGGCKTIDTLPCYIYRREDTFRFKDTDGKTHEFTLDYPGGC